MFKKVLDEFRQHKVIDGLIVVLFVAMVVMIVITVNLRKSAEVAAVVSKSPQISAFSSGAELSEPTTSSASDSSAALPTVSSASQSSAKVNVAPSTPTNPTAAPSKAAITLSKPTTSTTPTTKTLTPTTTPKPAPVTNPLYVPIPYGSPHELITKSMGGGSFTLNINAFCIGGYVSSANVSQYMCDDAYFNVTENSTGKVMAQSVSGVINNENEIDVSSGLDSYQHGSRYWLTPATYTVHVWCQKGEHSMNTTAGRPDKVDVCTFSFSVYEKGFTS